MKHFWILLIAVGYLNASGQSSPTRHRPIFGYKESGCFKQAITPLTRFPPLRTDMSLNTFLGYTYIDSLCRTVADAHALDSVIKASATLDSLKYLLKYYYALTDYDATLFREYEYFGWSGNPAYHINPGVVPLDLFAVAGRVLGIDDKRLMLCESSAILHVRASTVLTDIDSNTKVVHSMPLACVYATILDTIKGQHLVIGECHTFSTGDNSRPCVNFKYSTAWRRSEYRGLDYEPSDTRNRNGHIVGCDDCYDSSAIQPGREYIVFLNLVFRGNDSSYSYYDYKALSDYDPYGGILPIVDGNVLDPNNYFGLGSTIPLSAFEAYLHTLITAILNP